MTVHCRHRNPLSWHIYRKHLRAGYVYVATNSFPQFIRGTIEMLGDGVPHIMREPQHSICLDNIESFKIPK